MLRPRKLILVGIWYSTIACLVATTLGEEIQIDFSRDVLPILSDKCFVCHGPDTQEEGLLRLDSYEEATRDLGGYVAIDPQDASNSWLLERVHSTDDPMPPVDAEKQLTASEKDILTRWIKEGGKYAQHWAFVPPTKTPESSNAASSIDGFIGRELKRAGVDFANEADPATLARRAAYTLTGLPPEPSDLESYLSDRSPAAWERYLERLFLSKRYGEHQARFWLDAVRYGDTHGLHLDNRRGIYPYRDWVVRAMNRNMPLDTFIQWQIAGDLLPDSTPEQKVATGFVRMNPSTSEGGAIAAEFQAKNSFDRTETLGTVLLGMTLTCARCHSHKYDPISQQEYYELLAFFNNTAENPLDGNKYEYGTTLRTPADQDAWEKTAVWRLKAEKLIATAEKLVERGAVSSPKWSSADTLARLELLADHRREFQDTLVHRKAKRLLAQWAELEKDFTTTLIAKELDKRRETRLLERGEYDRAAGPPLMPSVPKVMGAWPADAPRNRLGLAQWLISPEHPLTSRVLVNRIWQRVFGYGLVRSPEDFGLQGQQPTHPELLDWLAMELQTSGWDLQHLLRLMLTSRTFRQSSAWRTDLDDPENKLYGRGPSYRLDAEVIRDTALWASKLLDPHMGGEGVKPYQPVGMWKALAHPASNTKQYVQDSGDLLYRRSLYIYWKRTSPHPMMTLFDAPDRESSCVRRSRTNTSLQSLGLLNETQRVEMARKFAERILKEKSKDADRIDRIFELLACRKAKDNERKACLELVSEMRTRYRAKREDAEQLLKLGEASRDATLATDELAAWTQLAVTILASDIAILLY